MQVRSRFIGAVVLLAVASITLAQVRTAPRNVDYPFSGNPGSQRYSTLTQINAQNVSQLKEAWRYDLGGAAPLQNQPGVVDGVIYGMGLTKTYALDAAPEKVKWEYDPPPIPDETRAAPATGRRQGRALIITRVTSFALMPTPAKSSRPSA